MTDSNGSGAPGGTTSSGPGDGNQQVTGWAQETRRYRRGLGGWWWAALLVVPFVLALVGQATMGSHSMTPSSGATSTPPASSSTTTTSTTTAPKGFSIVRNGEGITLTGVVPDQAAVKAAEDAVKAKAPNAMIHNELTVSAGAPAVSPEGLAAFVGATADVTNASLAFDGTTAVLTGQAKTAAVKAAAETAAKSLFPAATISNQITVAAATDGCTSVKPDVNAIVAAKKITFNTGGAQLTPASKSTIAAVAAKLKPCPRSMVEVNGYTDNSGSDDINVPLSQQRANAVKAQLIAGGVPAANVTAKGFGSKNPIAPNDTDANKALNRRVEIVVK